MASTKIRTGRRSRDRVSLRNTAVDSASGTVRISAMADLLEAADDGVGAAARRRRLGGGDAALVLRRRTGAAGRRSP